MNNDDHLINIGEFASKAGITLRTLRYYDNIGLLKPCSYSDTGHRMYNKQDFAKLQKILTLKFIGFSLNDIKNVVKHDVNDKDFRKSLEIQKKIMEEKIHHTHMVIKAIDETLDMLNYKEVMNWDKFVNIMNVLNTDKKLLDQYKNASNLRSRINIHELYSVNKYGWMKWFFEQLNIPKNAKILEVGCGDASLWEKNLNRIPKGWDITLTDFSKGMLEDAKRNLGNNATNFKFKIVDAQDIPFDDCSFDVVIANHMLYHVENREKAFAEIARVLKMGGCFYTSTVGKNHMAEMRELIFKFKSQAMTSKSWDITSSFQLENGFKQIDKWFKNVKLKKYEDSLIVTEPEPLIDYIFSMPGNVKESFNNKKLKQFEKFLQDKIYKEDGIYITKDTGFFEAKK
ncbi:MerR family transcriptional regulator [Clostridium ganghwense]|uniref:MerR family transcriptional regulator n=1 Tax=Clostridium ganghwense TaxID=312089 RepID=A0ABT4CQH0_9CLOT|nr:MerR family transcriptional regulator [Clostridium ganghwense]